MRPGTRRFLYLLLFGGFLTAVYAIVPRANEQRVAGGLVQTQLSDAATPGLMLGPLLAIGRAPLVDYLWMRATKLKEEGRYFDAYQLAETIGRLQPKFAAVWAFNAWNMAYNISVTCRTAEDRWRWIKNGIELLRDQGLRHNPRNVQMYKELAWLFFHKVGDFMDEKHMFYKLQLALQMEDILGAGNNPDYAAMAAAPQEWSRLVADPAVAEWVKSCEIKLKEDVSKPGVFLGLLSRESPSNEQREMFSNASTADSRRRIEMFWRAKRLREEVKLDPARIIRLRETFGPLDFRIAEAHSLYWANLGVEIGSGTRVAMDIDKLNTDRIELYCLQNFFRRGRLIMSPEARKGEAPMLLPDLRFADIMRRAFIAVSKNYETRPEEGPVHTNFESALINFVREAAVRFNESGMLEKSREYYEWLKTNYPKDPTHLLPYERFIAKMYLDVTGDYEQLRDVTNRVLSMLYRGVQLIGYGEYEEGASCVVLARQMWMRYEKSLNNDRYRMKPFPEMYRYVVDDLGPRMRPESYERVLLKTGFPRATGRTGATPSTQPAEPTSRPAEPIAEAVPELVPSLRATVRLSPMAA